MKLILLEDDPLIAICTQDALLAAGFEVLTATNGGEALALLARTSDVLGMLIDVRLSEPPDGWEVARRARRTHPHLAIIYTTTTGSSTYRAYAVERSILLEKPYTLDRVANIARAAIMLQARSALSNVGSDG